MSTTRTSRPRRGGGATTRARGSALRFGSQAMAACGATRRPGSRTVRPVDRAPGPSRSPRAPGGARARDGARSGRTSRRHARTGQRISHEPARLVPGRGILARSSRARMRVDLAVALAQARGSRRTSPPPRPGTRPGSPRRRDRARTCPAAGGPSPCRRPRATRGCGRRRARAGMPSKWVCSTSSRCANSWRPTWIAVVGIVEALAQGGHGEDDRAPGVGLAGELVFSKRVVAVEVLRVEEHLRQPVPLVVRPARGQRDRGGGDQQPQLVGRPRPRRR